MKWFQGAGDGKWIETDGPFSIFGEGGGIGCLGTIVVIAIACFFVFRPLEFFDCICKVVYWIFEFICNSKFLHSLDNLGNWG